MKPHLPVFLFRVLTALCVAAPAVSTAAYNAPTIVTTPTGYETVMVDALDDLTPYSSMYSDAAFRITTKLEFNKLASPLMTEGSGSWYFSCSNVKNLTDLKFYKAKSCIFDVQEDESLEFTSLNSLNFDRGESFTSRVYNTLIIGGGVISGGDDSSVILNKIKNLTFSENSLTGNIVTIDSTIQDRAESRGGVIHAGRDSQIKLYHNDTVLFSQNVVTAEASSNIGRPQAFAYGGAISGNIINLSGNGKVSFVENQAVAKDSAETYAYGGAISGNSVTLNVNDEVEFINNSLTSLPSNMYLNPAAVSQGSAIYTGDEGSISIQGNGSVLFEGNLGGSVIQTGNESSILIKNNKQVTFTQNGADNIVMGTEGTLTIRDNGTVELERLSVGASSTVTLQNNKELTLTSLNQGSNVGNVSIVNNTSITQTPDFQQNIQGQTLTLSGNSSIVWAGNLLSTEKLTIQGNGTLQANNVITDGELSITSNTALTAVTIRGGSAKLASNKTLTLDSVTANGVEITGNTAVTATGTLSGGADGISVTQNTTLNLEGDISSTANTNVSNNTSVIASSSIKGDTVSITGNGTIGGTASLKGTDKLTIKNNGVITAGSVAAGSLVDISDNDGLTLSYAKIEDAGGILNIKKCGTLNFSGYSSSAISGVDDTLIELSDNAKVLFSTSNTNSRAINASAVTFENNKFVNFSSHHRTYNSYSVDIGRGGAAYVKKSFTLQGNETVTFENNSITLSALNYNNYARGGAIYGGEIVLKNNNTVTFNSNNTYANRYNYYYDKSSQYAEGGAIHATSSLILENNGAVSFISNSANTGSAGSSYSYYYSAYAYGGAIYGSSITLSNNTSLIFRGNSVEAVTAYANKYAKGGAIYAASLTLQNNGSVLFEKNMVTVGSSRYLRSAHISSNAALSAAAGKKIEFRDSLYVEGNLDLNADYVTTSGSTLKQTGDIVFTGAYTEAHLKDMLGEDATTAQIENSRTSAIGGTTTLHGGRLIVEDGAVFGGCAFTAAAGSSSTVVLKDATFKRGSNAIAFNGSTTLDLQGNNTMIGKLSFASGSTMRLRLSDQNKVSSDNLGDSSRALLSFTSGSWTMESGSTLDIRFDTATSTDGLYMLTHGVSVSGWWDATDFKCDMPVYTDLEDSYFGTDSDNNFYFYFNAITANWDNWEGNGLWDKSAMNWYNDDYEPFYRDNGFVYFRDAGAGTVSLVGTLCPYEVTVYNSEGKDYTWQGPGNLSGSMKLIKMGEGTLTIKNTNDFTGGTSISGGKVVLGATNALGTGAVSMTAGTLDLGGKWTTNNITLKGSGAVQNGGSFKGNFTLNGTLWKSSALNIINGKTATLQSGAVHGKLSGSGKIVKNGSGTVTIHSSNTLTGGANMSGGKLVLNAANALGTGNVTITAGTLDLGGKWTPNNIILNGDGAVQNGGSFKGNFTLNGTLWRSSALNIINGKSATLKSGALYGKLSGSGQIVKSGTDTVAIHSTNSLTGGANMSGGKLVLNAANALGTGAVTMTGGTLDLGGNWTTNNITLSGGGAIQNGSSFRGSLTLNGGSLWTSSSLNIIGGKTATLKLGTMAGKLTGSGETKVTGAVSVQGGRIQTNKLTISGASAMLTLDKSGLSMNKDNSVINVASKASLKSSGAITAKSLLVSGSSVVNAKTTAVNNLTLSDKLQLSYSRMSMYGNVDVGSIFVKNAILNNTGAYNRTMNVRGNIDIAQGTLTHGGSISAYHVTLDKGKLNQTGSGVSMKLGGRLTMNQGSALTTSGTLSAGAITLNGGTINLTSSTLKAVTVAGTLTLNNAIDLNLGCTNLVAGKDYKLITFNKTNLTKQSNLTKLLGMSGSGATLTLNSNNIAIRVTNTTAWNNYLADNAELFTPTATASLLEKEGPSTARFSLCKASFVRSDENTIPDSSLEEDEGIFDASLADDGVCLDVSGEEEMAISDLIIAEEKASFDRSGADALVQSNWGMLNAYRTFTNTISNRGSNSRALGDEQKFAVWMNAMGTTSRLSSDGVASGSDYSLFGAALGVELQLSENSSLGLAFGDSRGKVDGFTSGRIKQGTLHTALYGQHLLLQGESDALLLDWNSAYGRTESSWNGIEWEQRALQLDGRATYARQLNDKTMLSAFAGLQYYASESATVAEGCESGSIQNLRGEIGAGISHRATSKTNVYGELSFVDDVARNTPTATIGESRVRGANPGRTGINFTIGASYELTDKWSVNASYTGEFVENANAHSANVGATYKF